MNKLINVSIRNIHAFFQSKSIVKCTTADASSLPYPRLEHIDIEPENNNFGLRLYCLRFSESIVILFNGDRKLLR